MNEKHKLPEGWKWVRLGEVADFINGRAFKPDEWSNTGLPIIRIQNLTSIGAPFNHFVGVIDQCHLVQDGDLLISWSATLDVFLWLRGSAVLNQHIFKVDEQAQLVRRDYLYFAVREAMEEIRSLVHGATMRHITKPEFEAIEIPLPPLPEQKRIAAILNEQMAAVDKTRAAAQARLEAVKALPAAFLRKVFLGPNSQSWPKLPFGKVAMLQRGHDLTERERKEGPYPVVTSSGIVGTHNEYRMKGPGVVTGRSGSVGRVHFIDQDYWPHNTALYVKDFFGNDPRYIYFLLSWVNVKTVSSGTGVPTLDRKEVHKIIVAHPPLEEQLRLADMLREQMEGAQKVRGALASQLETINTLPASLLRRAFSGEL